MAEIHNSRLDEISKGIQYCGSIDEHREMARELLRLRGAPLAMSVITPIPMRLPCEGCGELHIDEGEFSTKPHHTHSCQFCGLTWRPAIANTVGVRFLPGFKNDPK